MSVFDYLFQHLRVFVFNKMKWKQIIINKMKTFKSTIADLSHCLLTVQHPSEKVRLSFLLFFAVGFKRNWGALNIDLKHFPD